MTTFTGTAGNNVFPGTQSYDYYYLESGGNDTGSGRGGTDSFYMGAQLTAADSLNGGANYDTVYLDGDYSSGLLLAGTTLQNIESIYFTPGNSYDITAHDRSNTNSFNVSGYSLGAGDTLRFDGSAETVSSYTISGGAVNDWMRGGAGGDSFYVTYGGADTVIGGHGNDTVFDYGGKVTAADRLSGGLGYDTLYLYADYPAGLTFSAQTLLGFEQITLTGPYDYDVVLHDAIIPAGETLVVNAYLDASYGANVDASQETNGNISFYGSEGDDRLLGGTGDDTFSAGAGRDTIRGGLGDDYIRGGQHSDSLTGGGGGDTFVFYWDESGTVPDRINDLTNGDVIDLSNIDVDPGPGYETFTLVTSFTSTPGEMRLTYSAGSGLTSLRMDMDGNSMADMIIQMTGQHTSFDNFLV